MITKQFLADGLGWGFFLWFAGYVLGIFFFFLFQPEIIGWVIMPIGITLLIWVLSSRVKGMGLAYHIQLAFVWTGLAIILDYFLLVKVFKPADGYYKLDVYLYYAVTFILPVVAGLMKKPNADSKAP